MKKIIIKNWQSYGDYMLFADIVSKNKFGIILETTPDKIKAFGNNGHLEMFGKILTTKKIIYEQKD